MEALARKSPHHLFAACLADRHIVSVPRNWISGACLYIALANSVSDFGCRSPLRLTRSFLPSDFQYGDLAPSAKPLTLAVGLVDGTWPPEDGVRQVAHSRS